MSPVSEMDVKLQGTGQHQSALYRAEICPGPGSHNQYSPPLFTKGSRPSLDFPDVRHFWRFFFFIHFILGIHLQGCFVGELSIDFLMSFTPSVTNGFLPAHYIRKACDADKFA